MALLKIMAAGGKIDKKKKSEDSDNNSISQVEYARKNGPITMLL